MAPFAFIGGMGYPELLVVGFIALLFFGKRLPEVARSLGKGVTEFKKGVQGLEDELRDAGSSSPYTELPHSTEAQSPQVPKFEPPVAAAETETQSATATATAEFPNSNESEKTA